MASTATAGPPSCSRPAASTPWTGAPTTARVPRTSAARREQARQLGGVVRRREQQRAPRRSRPPASAASAASRPASSAASRWVESADSGAQHVPSRASRRAVPGRVSGPFGARLGLRPGARRLPSWHRATLPESGGNPPPAHRLDAMNRLEAVEGALGRLRADREPQRISTRWRRIFSARRSSPSIPKPTASTTTSTRPASCRSRRARQIYLIDPLALGGPAELSPLGAGARVAGDPKIFHAAEYDIYVLKRDCCFQFANLFDTMISAQLLGYSVGGALEPDRAHFGVKLPKDEQRSDWSTRPLSSRQQSYAASDVLT